MINAKQGDEFSAITSVQSNTDDQSECQLDQTADFKGTSAQEDVSSGAGDGHVAPDGGWGWVVLAGSILILVFLIGTATCFGVLFSAKMGHLGASSTTVSGIFSLSGILFNVGVFFTDPLVKAFTHRPVAFISSMVASLSFMLLSFTNSIVSITVLYGIVIPMSSGIGSTVAFLIVPLYFDRHRGRAMAALISGVPVGGIILPLVMRGLQDYYGFAGAVLLHGALTGHCCVASALYRPVTNCRKNKTVCPGTLSMDEPRENITRRASYSLNQDNFKTSGESVHLQRLVHEPSMGRLNQQNKELEGTFEDDSENNISELNIGEHRKHKRRRYCAPVQIKLTALVRKSLAILKERQLVHLGFCHSLSLVSYFNLLMLIPFALESAGHSPQVSARSLSITAVANTSTRLFMVLIADCKWLNRKLTLTGAVFVVGICTFVFAGVTSSEVGALMSMVGVAVGIGMAISLIYTVMLDMLGLKLYATCISFSAILEALVYITIGPAIGALRDWSGSYSWSICACGTLQLSSALLLLSLSRAHHSNANKQP